MAGADDPGPSFFCSPPRKLSRTRLVTVTRGNPDETRYVEIKWAKAKPASSLANHGSHEVGTGFEGVLLLFPSYSRPAPRHGAALFTPFDFVCTGLFNVLEFPATAVPVGFSREGLPLSVQVIARRGNDHVAVAVAGALERAFGGWRRAEPTRG